MPFQIQASSPRSTGAHDPEDSTLSEAVQVVFPMEAEAAVLEWNHVPVLLSYRYDVSICLDDVIEMLTAVMSCDRGTYETEWPSNSFHARWQLEWEAGHLRITADWTSVHGDLTELLNRTGPVRVATADFVAEWREPIGRVLDGLRACGYTADRIRGLRELQRLHAALPRSGVLYDAPQDA